MKRKDVINKLLGEGLSLEFLSNLTDKQINELSDRFISEATIEVPAEKIDQVKDKLGDDDVLKVTEEDEEVEEASSPSQQAAIAISKKKSGKKPKEEMNEWVEGVVLKNYHPEVTTKKEIYEMIGSLSDSADSLVAAKNMFSVDEQQPSPSKPDTDAPVREKPTTRPGKPKRENPFEPKHKPKPKAKLPKELSFSGLGLDLKMAAE
jgi:hypothetical protein